MLTPQAQKTVDQAREVEKRLTDAYMVLKTLDQTELVSQAIAANAQAYAAIGKQRRLWER